MASRDYSAPGSNPEEDQQMTTEGAVVEEEEDRISSLPSSLISDNILSLLPTKDSVATSVLSTRWKELWTMTSRLNFEDDYLRNPPDIGIGAYAVKRKFMSFVYRVLLLGRYSRMTTFRLHLHGIYDPLFVNAALASVAKSNAQELDFCLYKEDLHSINALPSNLFTCTTLVELKLGGRVFMNVPFRVSLPCVKFIQLYGARFPDGDAITRLLSGCPVLGRLSMNRIMGKNVKVLNISVPSLTTFDVAYLRLNNLYWNNVITDDEEPTLCIVLYTPLLSTIYVKDYLPEGFVVKSPLHKLKVACLHLGGPLTPDMESERPTEDIHRAVATDLVWQLRKAENLSVLCKDISRCVLPIFENLTVLRYGDDDDLTLDMMIKFLKCTPKLHTFISVHGLTQEDTTAGDTESEPSRNIPECLLSHLKVVRVANVIEVCTKLHIAEYFLKNARVLEKFTMARRDKNTAPPKYLLNLLQRATSTACQIEIE